MSLQVSGVDHQDIASSVLRLGQFIKDALEDAVFPTIT